MTDHKNLEAEKEAKVLAPKKVPKLALISLHKSLHFVTSEFQRQHSLLQDIVSLYDYRYNAYDVVDTVNYMQID